MVVIVHVGCGVVAVASGVSAMLSRKGSRWHRRTGWIYLCALAGSGATALPLAAQDWRHLWPLVALGAAAAGLAALAVVEARRGRRDLHLTGMGSAYILMLTAFYVDNGPRLPLWDRLPPVLFWFLPAAVGLPILLRARRRARAAGSRRPAGRPSARSSDAPVDLDLTSTAVHVGALPGTDGPPGPALRKGPSCSRSRSRSP